MAVEPEPWWWGIVGPALYYLVTFLLRMLSKALQAKADQLVLAGQPGKARPWQSAAAVFANITVGKRPSFRPPPFGVVPTLPPPARVPLDLQDATEFRPTPPDPHVTIKSPPPNMGGQR